jgi:hypothetical protein
VSVTTDGPVSATADGLVSATADGPVSATTDGPVSGAPDGPVSEPPALETVAVGPTARGPREALRAVRYYAEHPEAAPRPAPLDRALWGLSTALRAARLLLADRALLRAALLPTALTVGGCLVLALVATGGARPDGEQGGATFQAFLLSFVALSSMPPTILLRLWLRVAWEARRALGLPPGEDPFPGVGFLRLAVQESVKALRQGAVVAFGLLPLLVVIRILPFGHVEAAVLAGAWAFYWIVIDAFELPIEVIPGPRHEAVAPWYGRLHARLGALARPLRPFAAFGRLLDRLTAPWHLEVRFTERHPWETAGLGVAVGAVLAVPVLGLFFRAVAITAATALVGRLGEPGQAPEAPFSDGGAGDAARVSASPPPPPAAPPPPWPGPPPA